MTAGQPVGKGISAQAAEELGLLEGTPVGSGVIDAYAGWVGTVAAPMEGQQTTSLDDSKHRLAAIAGTSTCHIVQSPEAVFVPGVWGPYKHAIFPGCESRLISMYLLPVYGYLQVLSDHRLDERRWPIVHWTIA